MKDIKANVAKNIALLRQANGMTQSELAEKLNYSDKAVSKWERAESMPDISVLVEIASLFSVSLDTLVLIENPERESLGDSTIPPKYNHGSITAISILLVWLIALLVFVIGWVVAGKIGIFWLTFIYAVPISAIVWLVLNSIWSNRRRNYLIISLLVWSLLVSVQLSLLPFGWNVWMIYLLGIPGQIIVALWSLIRNRSKK